MFLVSCFLREKNILCLILKRIKTSFLASCGVENEILTPAFSLKTTSGETFLFYSSLVSSFTFI